MEKENLAINTCSDAGTELVLTAFDVLEWLKECAEEGQLPTRLEVWDMCREQTKEEIARMVDSLTERDRTLTKLAQAIRDL